ncbi:hypothetical protein GF380_05435 [Candidatus Uhrbacteria bacterium]|nr:hypothetical protein [Candidatus Uhrbacteria bacterium]
MDHILLTIDLDNEASIRAAQKLEGIERVSDADYENEQHKVKFVYRRPE